MEEKPIRVAQIIGKTFNGGVGVCILNYYRHIDRNLVQFDFFVEDDTELVDRDEIKALGGRIIRMPSYRHLFRYLRFLKKTFRAGNYDVVHANLNALNLFPLRAAKKAKIPVRISHNHSTANPKERAATLVKNLLRPFSHWYATDYFACSEAAGRWLFGNRYADAGQIRVIRNAIDLDAFRFDAEKRAAARREFDLDGKTVFGHIGRFMPQKNHAFLLDVFAKIHEKDPETVLLLIGNGALLDDMKQRAEALGIADAVRFAGVREHPENDYPAMDCFLFPSLYEGLGIVLIEAQANGLHVLASDEVPRDAALTPLYHALPLGDAEAWADEALRLAALPREDHANALTDAGYAIQTAARELTACYQSLLADAKHK